MFGKFTKFTAYYSIKKVIHIQPNRQISNFHDILLKLKIHISVNNTNIIIANSINMQM